LYGWEFRGGETSVTVAEPDQKAAKVIAKRHLSGEPGSEPKRACDEIFNIYGIKRGGVLIARMRLSAPRPIRGKAQQLVHIPLVPAFFRSHAFCCDRGHRGGPALTSNVDDACGTRTVHKAI
jgi:hypothetical protein